MVHAWAVGFRDNHDSADWSRLLQTQTQRGKTKMVKNYSYVVFSGRIEWPVIAEPVRRSPKYK